jgi:hypothetical protein
MTRTETDAGNTVTAFLAFRDKVQAANLRIDNSAIIQLMVAERLNQIARRLDDLNDHLEVLASRQ